MLRVQVNGVGGREGNAYPISGVVRACQERTLVRRFEVFALPGVARNVGREVVRTRHLF